MRRSVFLKTKIPIIPYLIWQKRNSSKYYELISGDFYSKTIVLSWSTFEPEWGKEAKGKVKIFYNDTSLPERDWYTEIAICENLKEYIKQLKQLEINII